MVSRRCDVLIIGGGMVGASLACALHRAFAGDLDIAVVESFPPPVAGATTPTYQPSFDARATALSAGSREILERIGVFGEIARHAEPIRTIHVSHRGRPGSLVMDAAAEGLDALGYVVENHWLGRVLLAALAGARGIDWLCPATVEQVVPTADGARATVHRGDETFLLDAALAVIADGAGSPLARSLGIGYRAVDYGGVALIANVTTAEPHQGRAFERFTERGPMALLPLPDLDGHRHRSALVWTLGDAEGEQLPVAEESQFREALQQRFGYRLGRFETIGARHSYPLRQIAASEQARAGIALLGNAAHLLHPVAGQGFNLALRDVVALAATLVAGARAGRALGDPALLAEYVARQQLDQRRTGQFSDGLIRLFAVSQPAVAAARDVGFALLDIGVPLKSRFVEVTAGLADAEARW